MTRDTYIRLRDDDGRLVIETRHDDGAIASVMIPLDIGLTCDPNDDDDDDAALIERYVLHLGHVTALEGLDVAHYSDVNTIVRETRLGLS